MATHMIGRIRRRARRAYQGAAGPGSGAVRRVLRAGDIQAKLKVGAENDAYEREADAVAARVMVGPSAQAPTMTTADSYAQRMCADCEEEAATGADVQRQPVEEEEEDLQAKARPDGLQRQPVEEEEEELQPKAKSGGPFNAPTSVSAAVSSLRGGGQPLPHASRRFFESKFGANFSSVRVHHDAKAAATADAINARAFTTGRDIVFGRGEYAPSTRSGGELLAHELTHVLQQRGEKRGRGQGDSTAPALQRWAIGAAPVPRAAWSLVPQDPAVEDHRPRLNAAEAIVRGVLASRRCVNFFRDNCGLGEGAAALRNAFNQARIYFIDRDDNAFGAQAGTSRNIAYNRRRFRIGRFGMANTLLHEMFHTCDPNFDARDEIDAETAVERCRIYAPWIERLSATSGAVGDRVTITGIGFGPSQGSADSVEFNGVTANVISWGFTGAAGSSAVQIVCEVPASAATGDLVVINNRVRSNVRRFTVI